MAARVRSAREIASAARYESVGWPLTGNLWTQQAGETHLLLGVAEVRHPAACDADQYGGYGSVTILLDGEFIGSGHTYFMAGSPNRTEKVGIYFSPLNAVMAPDDDTTHAIIARVSDSCSGADQNFTFTSLKIDVVGVS